ncbi:MAG TPA: cytochrome c [Ureibacillus sp.]|nr:cytochrome c [Ureibacillus sp.]
MKKAWWLALVLGSAIALAACGGNDEEATDTDTTTEETATDETADDAATSGADGEALVKETCVTCHGGNLEGMGNTPSLADVGDRLSEDEIQDVILNGRGGMPGGLLQGEDAEAAAAWLAEQK